MSSPLEQAFIHQPELLGRIRHHISLTNSTELFDEIADYINAFTRHDRISSEDRLTKKRKFEEGALSASNGASSRQSSANKGDWEKAKAYFSVKEASFSVPQRKKLTLELSPERSDSCDAGDAEMDAEGKGGVRAVNPTTGEVEFGVAWKDIDQILCVPVPEKQQRTHNFVIIPTGNDGVSRATFPVAEQIVFTLPESFPKTATCIAPNARANSGEPFRPNADDETYITSTIRSMNTSLAYHEKSVILPDEMEFASAIPQSHRKGEKAFHVKAFRGSKEGYLYFLPIGIVFGFKKPLLLIQFHRIDSISYTSVLQRTFNIVVATSDLSVEEKGGHKTEEFEFSMVDQADFVGIDAWVRKHRLNDLSMAEQRRAKMGNMLARSRDDGLNGNGIKGEEGQPDQTGPNRRKQDERYEPGELERAARQAEQELQDQEDEEEEDYDPGSEGDSEGEGGSSEDEEEGGEGEELDEVDNDLGRGE